MCTCQSYHFIGEYICNLSIFDPGCSQEFKNLSQQNKNIYSLISCFRYLLRKHIQSCHMGNSPGVNTDQIVTALRMGGDEGVTVYMCEECNSVFLSQDDLAVHILAEHMKQGFSADSTNTVREPSAAALIGLIYCCCC